MQYVGEQNDLIVVDGEGFTKEQVEYLCRHFKDALPNFKRRKQREHDKLISGHQHKIRQPKWAK